MNYFYEPVNINQWNMFEKVSKIGHIEPFLATKAMQPGDVVFLHVGCQNKNHESGIYAIGEVVNGPYILRNSPEDYCNDKNTVDVKITKISYSIPFVPHDKCIGLINQFRTVHMIEQNNAQQLLRFMD